MEGEETCYLEDISCSRLWGGWLWAMLHPYSLSGGQGWECVLLKHLLSKTFKMLLISLLKRGSEAVTDTESS